MATLLAGDINLGRTATIASLALCGAVFAAKYAKRSTAKLPLPPGPSGLPLIGNVLDAPAENFWLRYKEWSDQYDSDVIYLNMMGTPVVVLNSFAACRELLEKRSSIYSSRPSMPMMNELIGFDWNFAFTPYNEKWKERRKLFQQVFHPTHTEFYRPKLLKAARNFLVRLLDEPEDSFSHCRMLAGSFILDTTYGIDVNNKDNKYIDQAERGMAAMAAGGTPGYLVDLIPSLKYVPSWLPGAQFKRDAKVWSQDVSAMPQNCLQFVEDGLKRGDARPCIATILLEKLDENDGEYVERKSAIRDVLGTVYAGKWRSSSQALPSPELMVSSPQRGPILTFFLAMAQNPDIQKKAQGAVDEVVSQLGRLPDFTEYRALPYIEAVVREVLRWRPVGPIAIPHQVIQDDVYNGYHIPAGTTIIPNVWAIAHDSALYGPNPGKFNPSRFMNASQTEINPDMPIGNDAFGYGRRICPGLQVAVESVWLVVVSVLSVFDVKPAADGELKGDQTWKYTSGLLIHPYPFKLQIVPRYPDAGAMIRSGVVTGV